MTDMAKLRECTKKQSIEVDMLDSGSRGGTWRLLDIEYDDPVLNLALEEAILERVDQGESPSTIRFWRNPRAVAVVGKFQNAEFEVNKEACRKYSVTVVRRFTGGGTVYNDAGNLNYSIAVRRDNPVISGVISEIMPRLCKGVVEGLRMLSLNAEFEHEGVYIHIKGRKVSGTAGIVKRDVVFVHGTLLVDSDIKKLNEILDVPPYPSTSEPRRFVRSIRREVTTVAFELGRRVTMGEVKNAIRRGFATTLGVKLKPSKPLESELLLAHQIASTRHDEILTAPTSKTGAGF